MKIPKNYRRYQKPCCLNCKHYLSDFLGYLLQDRCAINDVLVAAECTCDDFEEKITIARPIEIREWMKPDET